MAGAGYRDWAAGNIPTAAQFDTFLQEQTVMVFPTAAARDTALSTAKSEGMVTYQLDTNTFTVYTGAAWSTIGPVHGPPTTWTPTITQSGTVTKTVNHGTYSRVGRRIEANCLLTMTGSGSASNIVTLSLPVTCAIDNMVIGNGYLSDSSLSQTHPFNVFATASGVNCYMVAVTSIDSGTALTVGSGASTFVAALASGDVISMGLNYPAGADA